MGWLVIGGLALLVLLALWRLGRFDRAALELLGAALLVAMAGYAWQGRPGLPGQTAAPPPPRIGPQSVFAAMHRQILGEFDTGARWLTIAENYQRRGDTRSGAEVIRSGLRAHPNDMDLWLGLADALLLHADGAITPAAELAFGRAAQLAPAHPAPTFFWGLALAQNGDFAQAEGMWRRALAAAPSGSVLRPIIEEQLRLVQGARAATGR